MRLGLLTKKPTEEFRARRFWTVLNQICKYRHAFIYPLLWGFSSIMYAFECSGDDCIVFWIRFGMKLHMPVGYCRHAIYDALFGKYCVHLFI
jgi:hypothetical protein